MLQLSEKDILMAMMACSLIFVVVSLEFATPLEDARIEALSTMCMVYADANIPVKIDGDVSSKSYTVSCEKTRVRMEAVYNSSLFMPEVVL